MAVTQATLITDLTRIIQDGSYDTTEQLAFLNQAMKEVAGDGRVLLPGLEAQSSVTTDNSNPYVALPSDYQKNLFYVYNATKYWKVKICASLGDLYRRFRRLDQSGTIKGVAVKGDYIHYQRIPSSAETLQLHYYRKPYDMLSYTASTISFNGDNNTIDDSAEGLGDFKVGQVIDSTGTEDNNTAFTVTAATAASLTVSEAVTTEAAGTEFTLKSRPDGIPEHLIKPLLLSHAAMSIFDEIEDGQEGNKTNTARHEAKFEKFMLKLIAFIGPEGRAPQPINDELNLEAYI